MEILVCERQLAGGVEPFGIANSFETVLQLNRRFNPLRPGEASVREHHTRRAHTAINMAGTRQAPHRNLNSTSIEINSEPGEGDEFACLRFALSAIAVSGDTFLTWQKN